MSSLSTLTHVQLAPLLVLRIVINASITFIPPYGPYLAKELQTNMNMMALVLSLMWAFGVPIPILMLSIRHAFQNISHKSWVLVFSLASCLFGVLSCISPNIIVFMLTRGLLGGSYIGFLGAVTGYMSAVDLKSLGTMLAVFELGGSVSYLTPSISGWLLTFGWRVPFLVWAVIIFLAIVWAQLGVPHIPIEEEPTGTDSTAHHSLARIVSHPQALLSTLLIGFPSGYLLLSPMTVFGMWMFSVFHSPVTHAAVASLVIGVAIVSADLICMRVLDEYETTHVIQINSAVGLAISLVTSVIVLVLPISASPWTYGVSLFIIGCWMLIGEISNTAGILVVVEQLTLVQRLTEDLNDTDDTALESEFAAVAWSMCALGGAAQGLLIPVMWNRLGWRYVVGLYVVMFGCVLCAASLVKKSFHEEYRLVKSEERCDD